MTFDEARLMANVNARARRLFQDGYRARWHGSHRLVIQNRAGASYQIDTTCKTCDCPFFQAHEGRRPCKHLLGYRRLLVRQRACRRFLACLLMLAWNDLTDILPETSGDTSPGSSARPAGDEACERSR